MDEKSTQWNRAELEQAIARELANTELEGEPFIVFRRKDLDTDGCDWDVEFKAIGVKSLMQLRIDELKRRGCLAD